MQFNFISAARTGLSLAALFLSASVWANTNVGVSISVDQPGFYGRVDIGQQPPPVIYAQPIIIQQSPVAVNRRPIYMRVPPGHSKRWARYCGRYNACGQPVYFIQPHQGHDHDGYARDERRDEHRGGGKHGRGHDHDHGHGHDRGHGGGRH